MQAGSCGLRYDIHRQEGRAGLQANRAAEHRYSEPMMLMRASLGNRNGQLCGKREGSLYAVTAEISPRTHLPNCQVDDTAANLL